MIVVVWIVAIGVVVFKCPIVELVTSLLDVDVVSMVVVRSVVIAVIVGVVIGFVSIGAVVVVFMVESVWLSPPF